MGEIIHGIHLPLSSCAVMGILRYDAIHHRITEMHIIARHIYFRTQHARAVGETHRHSFA